MSCLFCDIAAHGVAAAIVYEDAEHIAFLDHRPVFPGHVLLMPKQHVQTLAELEGEQVGPFFQTAQRMERAVEKALEADGSFIAINNVVSQSVPHLHLHVVPRRRKDGLRGFFWPRGKYRDAEEQEAVAEKIRKSLNA
jgi:histidine triad (HIT) family protein